MRQHLRELLGSYLPADAAEAGYKRRMLQLATEARDPFSRDEFTPGHFTASGFVLDRAGERLLLILHGKLGRWLQPGGHVEPLDRDIVAAARRELREEVGFLDLTLHAGIFDLDIHRIPRLGSDPAHEHHDVRFLFRAEAAPRLAASDAHPWRWVALESVSALESDDSVMRAVAKLKRLLGRT